MKKALITVKQKLVFDEMLSGRLLVKYFVVRDVRVLDPAELPLEQSDVEFPRVLEKQYELDSNNTELSFLYCFQMKSIIV